MRQMARIYNSSVGRKMFVGVTGLFLCSFLVVHVSGNLLLFKKDGGRAFDLYTEGMSNNVFIRLAEVVLIAGLLVHILYGTIVWINNRRSRPTAYAMNRPQDNSSFVSRYAFWTGSVVFIFLVVHMNSFWIPTRFSHATRSMYERVTLAFASPGYDLFYILALILLSYHLRHGFQSAFQTFGLRPGWQRPIQWAAAIFWLVIPVVFAAMPIYFLWLHNAGGK